MLSNDVSHDAPAFVLFLFSLDVIGPYVMVLYQYFANFVCKIKALRALIFLSLIIAKSIKTLQYFRLFAAFKTLLWLFLPHFR